MRILVVEDEPALARRLKEALEGAGYAVDVAGDGADAELLAQDQEPDAIVLDLGLPGLDGLTLLERWRREGQTAPVLILTARGAWHEKVRGIDAGADDYMAKPFRMEEVLARLRALIRRAAGRARPELVAGTITLDPKSGEVRVGDKVVQLTAHELRVLSLLMYQEGRVVSQGTLADHLYGEGLERSNTVEVFVARLRRKLGAEAIETVRGLGYRMRGES